MGRTLHPFRMALEEELASWNRFRESINSFDQRFFDELMHYARHHADAGSLAGRPLLSEIIFISIALEQQKTLEDLKGIVNDLQRTIQNLEHNSNEK